MSEILFNDSDDSSEDYSDVIEIIKIWNLQEE